MFRAIGKFARDRKGAFAMQFALMAVPLCVCTGLAIDGGRAFLARFELASALDAAALAVGSTLDEDVDLDAVARKFVEMNFKTAHDDPISLELVADADDDDALTLKGSVAINTFFMPLVGQPYVTIEAESEVRRGGNNVEVALALDITMSMSTPSTARINGLKVASKLLIDEVVGTSQTPYFSKVAIAPWSQQIHVDDEHVNADAEVELRGALTGTTSITAATWRNGSTTTKTISQAGWRTNTGKNISAVTWKNGNAVTISGITKTTHGTSPTTRIRVQTSSAHGYANGDTVYLTVSNGSFTGLNGNRYKVADRTTSSPHYFWLQNVGTTTYTTPPTGSTSSTGTSQRCFTTTCELRVSATGHGFDNGDLIYINGVSTSGGGTSPNNTWGTTYTLSNDATDTFILSGTNGPAYANASANSGKASECYVSDCRYRITTSAAHSFVATDRLFIWGMTETGTGTAVNTAANSSIQAVDPSGSVFYLPGNGNTYKDWTSGGSVAECANQYCNVEVTSNSHGLSAGERVVINSVAGMTGINTCSLSSTGTCSSGSQLAWPIRSVSGNTFTLTDTTPAIASNYTSGGTAQCTTYGCNRLWFLNSSNQERIHRPSKCLVERNGGDAATDTAPGTAPLGILYTGDGTCDTQNYVTPLTANKTRLKDAIDDLKTTGSTAGQLGIAWAWYMLSPNFASVWDKEAVNAPKAYDTPELAKVAILMTDGEFNYATCSGVTSNNYPGLGGGTKINCSPATNPFVQAQAICTAMKTSKIIIYTVGLELGTDATTIGFLTNCATSPQHAHLASDADELKAAFQKIATSISKLRLSK